MYALCLQHVCQVSFYNRNIICSLPLPALASPLLLSTSFEYKIAYYDNIRTGFAFEHEVFEISKSGKCHEGIRNGKISASENRKNGVKGSPATMTICLRRYLIKCMCKYVVDNHCSSKECGRNMSALRKGFSFAKLASLHEYIIYQVPAFM